MDIQAAKRAMLAYLELDIPAFLWGKPGVGKSEGVAQVAKEWMGGVPMIDFRAAIRDAVDIRGLPHVDKEKGTARWLAPDELPREDRDGPHGILFMDELNAAPQAVQVACFGLVLDRKVGEYQLPRGWRIMAAGNRLSDKAAAQRLPSALANRFAHIDVEHSVDGWSLWAIQNGLPSEIVAFIRFRPALLHDMDEAMSKGEVRSFATPRSWERAARVMSKVGDADFRFQLVKGLVGEKCATELESFLRIYQELPSLDSILMNPSTAPIPTEVSAKYAIASGLGRKVDKGNFASAIQYASRLPKEFEVMMVIDAIKRDNVLAHSKPFTEWAIKNKSHTQSI